MIRFSFNMLFVGLILLFLNPASVFATTTTPAGPACTNGLVPCGSGCYQPAPGEVCCSNASTSWACPTESAVSNSPAIPSLFSTTSVTSMTTQTITLGSGTPSAGPAGSDTALAKSIASGTAGGNPAPSHSGMPEYSTSNHPSATAEASCVPTTVTVTSVSISYVPPTSSDVISSTFGTSASVFSNTTSDTQTALTSITLETSSETSVTSTIVTSQTQSTDVEATTSPPTAPTAPTEGSTTNPPNQPVTSYTPGNDSADARLPSIFGLYMILIGLAFI